MRLWALIRDTFIQSEHFRASPFGLSTRCLRCNRVGLTITHRYATVGPGGLICCLWDFEPSTVLVLVLLRVVLLHIDLTTCSIKSSTAEGVPVRISIIERSNESRLARKGEAPYDILPHGLVYKQKRSRLILTIRSALHYVVLRMCTGKAVHKEHDIVSNRSRISANTRIATQTQRKTYCRTAV